MKRAREGGAVEGLKRRPPPGMTPRLSAAQRAQLPLLLAKGAETYGYRGDVWTARRVEMLHEMTQQEVNRLHSGLHAPSVRASLEGTLTFLRQEIAKMQRLVQEQVERSADLQHKQRLLCSIPGGIGRWTAARVLAESEQVRARCERAPTGGVCGFNPAGTQLGDLGSASSALGQDGQQPLASRALPASDRGDAAQSGGTRLG